MWLVQPGVVWATHLLESRPHKLNLSFKEPLDLLPRALKFVVPGLKKKVSLHSNTSWLTFPLENALFAGLEAVQGPNWAAILQLYGPGGSISEALKDRSQVQLKDKARNLKLFFLKGGHEMPRVLEKVTGRLKGDRGEETPERRGKKRKTGDVQNEEGLSTSQPVGFGDAWQGGPGQGAEFIGVSVGQNVDPGLQMPQAG
jgi:hypothetical protein